MLAHFVLVAAAELEFPMTKTFKYAFPKLHVPPSVPTSPIDQYKRPNIEPLKSRISQFDSAMNSVQSVEIDPSQGAMRIESEAEFDALSYLDDVPGALGVREVKFLVADVQTATPEVYFMNTKNQKYHFLFARDVLNMPLDNGAFNAVTYFTQSRRFLAGTIIAHDSYQWDDQSSGH